MEHNICRPVNNSDVSLGYQFCKDISFILYMIYNVRYNNICYTVKRQGPSGATTFDSYWKNIKILVGRKMKTFLQATIFLLFFRDLHTVFLTCRKHDTPQNYCSLRPTVRLSVILCDIPRSPSPHTNRAGFPLSASWGRFNLTKINNTHIQSVNLYLWYKEEYDPFLL
jgi:hypothetical protein